MHAQTRIPEISTPFAGTNRSRFEGLRLARTLSALRNHGYAALPCRV
ncbi:hypothetical protein E9229_000482 [Paeniglutamicibacter cryotolerans]|uniref:Uncharacterized protein n=1 Tax=Paeniglutamicibacter cryotolerans TaxID=670079 RepID=A0A839QQD5_9MICC|nr:hypothetical protein [Paeniglutamicibacter cryotolerans]